jgi:hypothetical protein
MAEYFTNEDKTELGDDLIKRFNSALDRVGQAAYNQARTDTGKDRRAEMIQTLDVALPSWREINDNEKANGFGDWLMTTASNGKTGQQNLVAAWNANQAWAVLEVFNGFINSGVMQQGAQRQQETREIVQQASDREYYGVNSQRGGNKIWTRAEVQAHYKRFALHPAKTPQEEAEKATLEHELHQAALQGRIK